jgi:hypothetical protein
MRQAVIDRSRAAYYNKAEDMDARRANYVELVMDELEEALAKRQGAVIAPTSPAAPTAVPAVTAPATGSAPSPSASSNQEDPYEKDMATLYDIANGTDAPPAPGTADVSESLGDVKLADDADAFTGW